MTKGHPCGVSLAAGGHASQTYAKPPRDTFPSLDLCRSRATALGKSQRTRQGGELRAQLSTRRPRGDGPMALHKAAFSRGTCDPSSHPCTAHPHG